MNLPDDGVPFPMMSLTHIWNVHKLCAYMHVLYAALAPSCLPLPAWPRTLQTVACRPPQLSCGKPPPLWPSSVSGSECASLTTPSSSAANCSAAALREQHEPGSKPRHHENIHEEIITPIIHLSTAQCIFCSVWLFVLCFTRNFESYTCYFVEST